MIANNVRTDAAIETEFAIAIAMTADHALMACGFLAKVRQYHPNNRLYIFTVEDSLEISAAIAKAFGGETPVLTDKMGMDCLEWGSIVTSKIRVFALETDLPVVFLDIDQVLTGPLDRFVVDYVRSGHVVAGGADDETLGGQFRAGSLPRDLDPTETRIINTGAFIARPDRKIFEGICHAMAEFSGLSRLPTQGLVNGFLYRNQIPFKVFGDEFMIGPFNSRVTDRPCSATLIHLWTPRPPFMYPNPRRPGVDGDLTWQTCVRDFERTNGVAYPYQLLRDLYMEQIAIFERSQGRMLAQVDRPDGHSRHFSDYVDSQMSTDAQY